MGLGLGSGLARETGSPSAAYPKRPAKRGCSAEKGCALAAERNRIASNCTEAEMKPETHTPDAISAHCAAGMRLRYREI